MSSMTEKRKVTLAEVADHAGVSAITVSRALRQPAKVSQALRDRIAQSVAVLGYVPDPAARALASGRTDVIGVVIPSVTNNVYSDVLRGIYGAIDGTAHGVQLGNTRYSPVMEEDLLRVFLSQKPAGLIVTGSDQSAVARALLDAAPCPVVQIMDIAPDPVNMMVGFSHHDAARAATKHLLAQGYQRPAFLGARMDPRTRRRFEGFRDTAHAQGAFDERRVVTTPAPSTVTLGAQLFADLIGRTPNADAVFCNNDDLALGALFEAQRRRLDVPGDIGICGFNDLEMMAAAEPPLTSVRTHRAEMGAQAVKMLLAAVAGETPEPRLVDLGYEVMARRSTGRPTAG